MDCTGSETSLSLCFFRGRSGIRVGLCAKIEWTISFDWQAGAATTVSIMKMLELLARCGCCCDSFAPVENDYFLDYINIHNSIHILSFQNPNLRCVQMVAYDVTMYRCSMVDHRGNSTVLYIIHMCTHKTLFTHI